MENINRRGFESREKLEAEDKAIDKAQNQTEETLLEYEARSGTWGGRYVCADTFKELMPGYAASPESRNRLNGAVHNAAAVLSSEQFKRVVSKGPTLEQDLVVFVTGIPGAGKSSTVATALKGSAALVFEGQMSNPESSIQKIDLALKRGFKVDIIAVHVDPAVALERTSFRFNSPQNGRGASISVMSDIQGNLPDGLRKIHERFGEDAVSLTVLDNNPGVQSYLDGWDKVSFLEKEGNREKIREKLESALEQGYRSGRYSADFYLQATGGKRSVSRSMETEAWSKDGSSIKTDGDRQRIPPTDSSHYAINRPDYAIAFEKLSQENALAAHPELARAFDTLDKANKYFYDKIQHYPDLQEKALLDVRQQIQKNLDRGELKDFVRLGLNENSTPERKEENLVRRADKENPAPSLPGPELER